MMNEQVESKMSERGYNGWTNRETWLINVWFNPESREDVEMARECFEEAYDQLPPFMKDFVSDNINWEELAEHFEEDEEDEE